MYKIRKYGISLIGKIIEVTVSKDIDGLTIYKPVIEFRTQENQIKEFTPPNATSIRPNIGSEVELKYLREHPDKVILNSKRKLVFEIALFVFALAILFIFSYNHLKYISKL